MHPALLQALLAVHRLLLCAYPRRFRSTFGDEMQAVFAEALERAARDGAKPAAAFIAREWGQAPGSLLEAHWRNWQTGRPAQLAGGALQAETGMFTRRITSGFAITAAAVLILMAFGLWLLAVTGWGPNSGIILPGLLLITPMVALVAWIAAPVIRRVGVKVWIGAGLFCLAGLAWPTSLLVEDVLEAWPPLVRALLFFLPAVALIVAALILAAGVTHFQAGQTTELQASRQRQRWMAMACLLLSTLVVLKTLANVYWLMVWDTTYDALGFLWLIPIVLAALFGGIVLAAGLAGRARWTGAYGLLIPAVLIMVSARAQSISFRQLTAERAERVVRALDNYYVREGQYPHELRQLIPWYTLTLPGPVIINGQRWCYQGTADGYQLGYVDREHWSSPDLTAQLYSAKGPVTDGRPLCEAEITALRQPAAHFAGGWAWPFAGPSGVAQVTVGMSRAQVLERTGEVWHRDGCAPRRPTGEDLAYTDLFWTGSRDVTQARVVAVHYEWAWGAKRWMVNGVEIADQDQLYALYDYCSTLDLTPLAGPRP